MTTVDIKTKQITRADLWAAFGGNVRLVRVFEQLLSDITTTIPNAIVQVGDLSTVPFLLTGASTLAPNASVIAPGSGIKLTKSAGTLTVAVDAPLTVVLGGTGATTAAAARGNLEAAQSGVNNDITSLTGLTTPLPINEGGTGQTTAATALTALGGVNAAQAAAAAPVQSVFGRTGNVLAASGDYSVADVTGAAHAGANSDITSLTGLTTPLSVGQGGTGQNSIPANAVVLGNGAGAVANVAAGANGSVFMGTGGAPAFVSNPTLAASLFYTTQASVSAPNGVATTIYTLPNATPAVYLVSANVGGTGDTTHYNAFAIVIADGSSARLAFTNNGTLQTITLSGLAVQSTQSSGVTLTINMTVTRVG